MGMSTASKAKGYRERMRARGMRPIQIWVPDARSPRIARQAREQSLLVARQPVVEEETLMDNLEWTMAQDAEWTD